MQELASNLLVRDGQPSRLSEIRSWSRHLGRAAVGRLAAAHVAQLLVQRGLAMSGEPGLDEMLHAAGGQIHLSPQPFLAELGVPTAQLPELYDEFRQAVEALERRYDSIGGELPFPAPFRVQEATALCLYAAVRTQRPSVVVETGVANGHSSFFILTALTVNGCGRLHSFDIDPAAGVLVNDRNNWDLRILRSRDPAGELSEFLQAVGGIDLFFHDADHRYLSQLFEYRSAWQHLHPGGLLLSDDVDDSRAFFDFGAAAQRVPTLLFDSTKIIGGMRR